MQLAAELHFDEAEPDESGRPREREDRDNEKEFDRDAAFGGWHFAGTELS
jgi:hypothetical protein